MKLSEKVNEYTAKDYWVTCGSWSGNPFGLKSYEIGVRHKTTGEFTLIQSGKFNHQTVQEAAEIVCLGLDHGHEPLWIQEMFA